VTARGHDQALLVAEIASFLEEWQLILNRGTLPDPSALSHADRQAEQLRVRATDAGIGGLAHHFAQCRECLKAAPLDANRLRGSLRAISELTWQFKQELRAPRASSVGPARAAPDVSAQAWGLEPPRLLSGAWKDSAGLPPADIPAPTPPRAPEARLDQSMMAPPLLSIARPASPLAAADPAKLDQRSLSPSAPLVERKPAAAPPPVIAAALPRPPDAARSKSARPALEAQPGPPVPALVPRRSSSAPAPAAPRAERPPHVDAANAPGMLATFFGFRGFNQAQRGAGAKAAAKGAQGKPNAEGRDLNLFGFRKGAPSGGPVAPPPLLAAYGGLPPLPSAQPQSQFDRPVDADLEARLRQLRPKPGKHPRPTRHGTSHRSSRSSGARQGSRHAGRFSWPVALLAAVVVAMVFVGIALLVERTSRARARAVAAASAATAAPAAASGAPTAQAAAAAAPATQQFQELVVQIQGFGGESSPELAALLNAEASAAYQALSQPCAGGQAHCESQRLALDLLTPRKLTKRDQPRKSTPRWMAGLKIPAIGAQDHPDVQRWLEYYSGHSVGRELFQTMLFRCGAHLDVINKALVHYGLPQDLLAVVLTESQCVTTAESPVGARGLWQFMAPTARAYHLLVEEGVVDERVSPVKATDAAVRYLADLYRKLGNWEMAFASYNAGGGPFRMLARLRQAGETVTFWDLADAELIPEETAKYVPRIQAYALILANLRHFDFSTAQMRTAEETADLEVPSGTRLGQVARAAGTSVAYLRSLNPDLIGTVIPNLQGKRFVLQVPKTSAFRARETLEQFLLEQLDLCVSSAFDWGREQFTGEMQAKCAARKSR